LCELQATLEAVTAAKGAPGFAVLTVAADATGAPTVLVHPIVKVERETALALRAYYAAFGLEPSARSRLHVAQAAPPEKATKWPALV
jgi:phage terminase small subunit